MPNWVFTTVRDWDELSTGLWTLSVRDGYAADIDVGGDARSNPAAGRKGDNICIAVLKLCGMSQSQARAAIGGPRTNFTTPSQYGNWSVEVGWRTLSGGNHFNHVHVGFNNRPPVGKNDPGWTGANK